MAGMKPTEFDVRLGARLRDAREGAALTQRQMAEAIGVSPAQFQKYEQGINRISASALQVCARMTDCAPGWFFDPGPSSAKRKRPEATAADLGPALARTRKALQRLVADLSGAAA